MDLRHIVAATDESDAGRRAVRAGTELARQAGAHLTVLRVVAPSEAVPHVASRETTAEVPLDFAIAIGSPGIEICRFAEDRGADLLILGRKQRSGRSRLLLGDTADAVARRSLVPCLFVSQYTTGLSRVLVALDRTPRGLVVLRFAARFAGWSQGHLHAVTVEPPDSAGPGTPPVRAPSARSERLGPHVSKCIEGVVVEARQGEVVGQILQATEAMKADVLVTGCHRGGPPGILEAGSTARRLAHTAPCAVLTVPL